MFFSQSRLFIAGLLVIVICFSAFSDIPKMISYQGRVIDNGTSVEDGTYDMRFRIYNAESGGSLRWDSNTQPVQLAEGVFSVLLGESPQPALDLEFDEECWLLVTFESVDQTPRQRMASVGFSYMASGLVPGTEVEGSVPDGNKSAIKGTNTATIGYGLLGKASASTGFTYGVNGQSMSTDGTGVSGHASAISGLTRGVNGSASSPSGTGVYGLVNATTGQCRGVYGHVTSSQGYGVYGLGGQYGVYGQSAHTAGSGIRGWASASSGANFGVSGHSSSTAGRGVYGTASTSSGVNYGVYGRTSSSSGTGVYGMAIATSGLTYGLYGQSDSSGGIGAYARGRDGVWGVTDDSYGWAVYGNAESTTGTPYGVYGKSASSAGIGVFGYVTGTDGVSYGVYGKNDSENGRGVYGYALASNGANYGVYGKTNSPTGFGGYFYGDVHITGNLSKGGGSFVIDHPLDPENKLLRHNFVESPDHLLIYQGKAMLDSQGEAIVELPVYFQALTIETEATIQLTPVGRPFLSGVEWNPGFQSFTIFGDGGRQVFWEVLAKRDDPVIHQFARPVEEEKGPDNKLCNKGQLLYPTAYGFPESFGRDFRPQTRPEVHR